MTENSNEKNNIILDNVKVLLQVLSYFLILEDSRGVKFLASFISKRQSYWLQYDFKIALELLTLFCTGDCAQISSTISILQQQRASAKYSSLYASSLCKVAGTFAQDGCSIAFLDMGSYKNLLTSSMRHSVTLNQLQIRRVRRQPLNYQIPQESMINRCLFPVFSTSSNAFCAFTTKSIYFTHNDNKRIFIRKIILGTQEIDLFLDLPCAQRVLK